MAKVDILDWQKKSVGQVELPTEVFEVSVKKHILHTVVRWQRACRRQGTHQAKTKGMVRGGGRKPFRQKGTGNARQGSIRSPLMEGGGVTFAPKNRDYSYALPKKIRQLGLKMTLSYLHKNNKVIVLESMTSVDGKTKELSTRLKNFDLKKSYLVDSKPDTLFQRASHNLKGFCYRPVEALNVYDLLKYDHLFLTKEAVDSVSKRCGAN